MEDFPSPSVLARWRVINSWKVLQHIELARSYDGERNRKETRQDIECPSISLPTLFSRFTRHSEWVYQNLYVGDEGGVTEGGMSEWRWTNEGSHFPLLFPSYLRPWFPIQILGDRSVDWGRREKSGWERLGKEKVMTVRYSIGKW